MKECSLERLDGLLVNSGFVAATSRLVPDDEMVTIKRLARSFKQPAVGPEELKGTTPVSLAWISPTPIVLLAA